MARCGVGIGRIRHKPVVGDLDEPMSGPDKLARFRVAEHDCDLRPGDAELPRFE